MVSTNPTIDPVNSQWAECPGCGRLQILPAVAPRHVRRCGRCGNSFGHGRLHRNVALALGATALVLFATANLFPLIAIELGGRGQSVRLSSGVGALAGYDLLPLALFVLLISVAAPLLRVLALCAVLLVLGWRTPVARLAPWVRLANWLQPWAMLDVFLVGTLVALTKLHDLAQVTIGVGLWSLGLLVLTLAAFETAVDRRALWDVVSPPKPPCGQPGDASWIGCESCGLVQTSARRCVRCQARLHRRKPGGRCGRPRWS